MGSGVTPTALPPTPLTPDAQDLDLLAARRAKAFSLVGLGTGWAGNFVGGAGPKAEGLLSYGQSWQSLLGGATQVGDEQGQYQAPTASTAGAGAPSQADLDKMKSQQGPGGIFGFTIMGKGQ